MNVRDISTQGVETIRDTASVATAAERMWGKAVGCLVVVDGEGRAVGIVTDRDLALRVVGGSSTTLQDGPIRHVMSSPLTTVTVDASLESMIDKMRGAGLRRMPVCENDRPVGIVTFDDVLQSLSTALYDISAGVASRQRRSRRRSRMEVVRDEVEETLEQVRDKAAYARWNATGSFLELVDQLEDRLKDALGIEE